MKRKNNLYDKICDYDVIFDMYFNVIRKNTKNKRKLEKFETFLGSNITCIYENLKNRNYEFKKYNIFLISDPKYRIIMSEGISDKIVNHLVSKYILSELLGSHLIDSNCATRVGKGTKYCNYLVRKYLNNIKYKYNNFYVLKIDIKKYFYNIDHSILIDMIKKKCKDQDSIKIITDIINTTNEEYINKNISNIILNEKNKILNNSFNKKKISELNSIKLYEKGKGLPIGNMSSQILAIFYLSELDHFIKEKLKIKYYVRYMDDLILIHRDKNYLNYCFKVINDLVNKKLKLELNEKSNIYDIKHGFNFLGFRYKMFENKIVIGLCKNTKTKMYRNIKNYKKKNLNLSPLISNYESFLKISMCKFKLSVN